ncbi:uncharacterized protein [Haliaeetus albicilla]|uniref:uncharacterized protein n=1 Tax=Haliaeetus albicilla TaxID=8969 RepID=UPI0037E7F47E
MAPGLGPWLLALALAAGPAGLWAQLRLVEDGGGLRAPGETVSLSCRGSGFNFGNSTVWWYRQAAGGSLDPTSRLHCCHRLRVQLGATRTDCSDRGTDRENMGRAVLQAERSWGEQSLARWPWSNMSRNWPCERVMESTANRQHLGERATVVSGDPWEQDITLLPFLQHTSQQQTPMAEEKTSDPDSWGEMAPAAHTKSYQRKC